VEPRIARERRRRDLSAHLARLTRALKKERGQAR
jgi:hypothetical protein